MPILSLSACFLLAMVSAGALADEGLRLSGFGTLGYASDNRSNIAAARDVTQLPEHRFATGGSWKLDSRIGTQIEYAVAPNLDLVGQLLLHDEYKINLDSLTKLAYAIYRPDSAIDLRLGRINYDAFLMTDYRDVGYAYPWVRPPQVFYSWIPVFSLDGADLAYMLLDDDVRWRFKAQAGRSAKASLPIGPGYDFHANDLIGVSVTRQTEYWRLKAAYSQFTNGSEVPAFGSLHRGLDQIAAAAIPLVSAEAADLRYNLTFKGAKITYATLGAAYDDGVWLAQGELGQSTSSRAVVPHGVMGYASLGRRFGDWTPYLLWSAFRPENDVRLAANNWGPYNAPLRDPAVYVVNTIRIDQRTISLGTRWDFARHAALKLQLDSSKIQPSGYGLWWRDTAVNSLVSRIDLFTASVDFTF